MSVAATDVKKLREQTGAGFMDCKSALAETNGDFDKAVDLLRKKGIVAAGKRRGKSAQEGSISSYIHAGGKIGVMVELRCETDFVARTDDFQNIQKDLAMHIAATAPCYLTSDEVPQAVIDHEREIFSEQSKQSGKPDNVIEKIVEGRIKKFFGEICLLEQQFVKDDSKKISDIIDEVAGKLGENIYVARFCRYELGDDDSANADDTE